MDGVEAMSAHDRHHCKECNEALVEGRAYELGGYRWHVDCFICSVCSRQLNADTNMLVLGNGTLVCNNCSYYCNICHTKIERLAILTNDQAFCSSCFICRNCKHPIEDLKYARTPHGIFCMGCHNIFMARKMQRQSRRSSTNSPHRHKQLPTLPGMPHDRSSSTSIPTQSSLAPTSRSTSRSASASGRNSRTASTGTIPLLGSPLDGPPPTNASRASLETTRSASESLYPAKTRDLGIRDTFSLRDTAAGREGRLLPAREREREPEREPERAREPEHERAPARVLKESFHDDLEREHNPLSHSSLSHNSLSHNSLDPHKRDAREGREGRDSLSLALSQRDSQGDSLALSLRDSTLAVDTPDSTTNLSDFHSARTSLEDHRDGLASPMGTGDPQDTPIRSETSKFDKDLQKALLSSPPPMSLELKHETSDLSLSGLAIHPGSPTQRRSRMAPHTPRKDLNIPPRSPARTPSRTGSPELQGRSEAPAAAAATRTTELADISVPKRSNLRGTSPSARTILTGAKPTSAPGPLPTSPRWARASEGINSITAASRQHKRSFSDNQNTPPENDMFRSLVVAQHRIRSLEQRLESQGPESLLERKSTLASLEARKTIAREELAAINTVKQESAAKDEQLSAFGSKLELIKSRLEEDIAQLVAQKERLKLEVSDLTDARDKAIEESSLLNMKNTQLTDLNNELARETIEKFALQHNQQIAPQPSSSSPSKLWEKRKAKRKEVGSGTRAPSGTPSLVQPAGGPSGPSVGAGSATASIPSPYMQAAGNPPGFQGSGVVPSSTGPPPIQSFQPAPAAPQFVTVLNQEGGISADKKTKLWPWKRTQRGPPRAVEIEEMNTSFGSGTFPQVTHLGNGSGVTGLSGGGGGKSGSTLLGESLVARVEADGTLVPILVTRCIEEVEKRGLDLEGIYRKSGSKSQIDALMEHFETHNPETAAALSVDISAVTSALKQYLRYLKDPVITYQTYNDFVRAGRTQNITLLQSVVASLPPAHNRTLSVLVAHLGSVRDHGARNLMNTVNLATVFAPTLTRDITGDREMADMQARNDATQLLIDNYDSIFE